MTEATRSAGERSSESSSIRMVGRPGGGRTSRSAPPRKPRPASAGVPTGGWRHLSAPLLERRTTTLQGVELETPARARTPLRCTLAGERARHLHDAGVRHGVELQRNDGHRRELCGSDVHRALRVCSRAARCLFRDGETLVVQRDDSRQSQSDLTGAGTPMRTHRGGSRHSSARSGCCFVYLPSPTCSGAVRSGRKSTA